MATGAAIIGIVVFVLFMIVANNIPNLNLQSNPVDFSNVRISSVTENSAVVVGTTIPEVNCSVEYGTNGKFTQTASDTDMMGMPHGEHLVTISDLQPNTEYNYRFKATLEGKDYYSETQKFVTSD